MEDKRLLDICKVYQPQTIAAKSLKGGDYPVFGANGIIGYHVSYNHENAEVVMGCRGSCGALHITEPYSWINGNAMVIHPLNENTLLKKYLFYALLSKDKRGIITGTANPQITQQNLKDFYITICDIPEQQRIVSRIEELFSQLDDGVETLKKTKAQLAVYRQAVLKEAFEKIDGQKKSVDDVCKGIKVGIVIKPAQYYTTPELGIKAFRSANVREFHIDDFDWVYLSREGQIENTRTIVHTDDVLIVRSGYPGTACVVTKEFDGCNAIDVLIAVPNKDIVLPEYLCAFTNSPLGKSFVAEKKRGVGQKHFNVNGYKKMPITVPSIEEQRKIVENISERLSVYDSIKQTVDISLQQADALRQSILKKAFEGGL